MITDMKFERKTLVSGIQSTGAPHIGNYFGAMKQFVDMQNEYDCFIFAADYHALTTLRDPKTLADNTLNLFIDLLAIGIDPEKVTLYKQSDVPEVTELAWIFSTLVTTAYMERAHAFKDKTAKGIESSVGLFTYPILMAADILMPGANVVPVGQDQKQHVEYARDIAEKFNNAYGETFTLPEPLILKNVAVVPGTDGEKMSKSYNNTIPLFATRDEITKAVMSIVTDSSGDFPKNVYALHMLFTPESGLKILYEENKGSYKILKEALIEDVDAFIAPMRARRADIASDLDAVRAIINNGGEKARDHAMVVMQSIREKVGLQ